LNLLLTIFANNILPLFLATAAGFILGRRLNLHPRPVSQVAFYIFSPCLVFTLLTTNPIPRENALRIGTFAVCTILLVGLVSWLAARGLRLERRMQAAVILTAMFGNAGNFGMSISLFAFGETALAYASLYFVFAVVLMNTVGTIIASLGRSGLKEALLGAFKVPAIYAAMAAVAFNLLGWTLPLPVERTADILGKAAIPTLMVLIGLQLNHARFTSQLSSLSLATGLRLLASPALALLLAPAFGLAGDAYHSGILESAMPSAVLMTTIASEFDLEPAFVTSVVVSSTLLSPLTLTPLLAWLGA
jgi:hypothetical protein